MSLNDLISRFKEDLLGRKVYERFGNEFPLLIKFIDAKTNLSIQLHPDDKLARERHNSFGKTEMWYILHADKGSKLNVGFQKYLTKEEYLEYLNNGNITEILHFEKVTKGDSIFIHPGLVHAIGGGILLAEIQQTSDITYRIYDWDRKDPEGNLRELHTDLALDAIDFKMNDDYKLEYEKILNATSTITSCPYFTTNIVSVNEVFKKNLEKIDSFVIYICVAGESIINLGTEKTSIKTGETVLIPADVEEIEIISENCELLEVFIE